MSKVFTAVIYSEEGSMSIVMGEDEVMRITDNGDVTLFGPHNSVLREYTEAEIYDRQEEIDDELKAIFDNAYEEGDGETILHAFAVLGANMETIVSLRESIEENDEPSATLN